VNSSWLLLVHAAATLVMTGLIWFVQIVHYPLFSAVGSAESPAYARAHQRLTTAVVGPVMLVEAACAVLLLVPTLSGGAPPNGRALVWFGATLLAAIWLSTALLQIPAHARLLDGYDPAVGRGLVDGNWIRTACWSARSVIALLLVRQSMSG
jgi:hypothetical protein